MVQPVALDESNLGFLKIGLSLGSMEIAWRNSLRAIVILGLAILAAGILGMAAIFHNQHTHLQEVKALEAEVLHRERLSALGNLAAAVAHEVRNPLNAISMGLQRLKVEFQPTDDQEDYSRLAELMLGEVHRLNSIVEQFLSLARPVEIKPEALPLQEILKELAALEDSDARRSKVQIRVIAAPNLPPLKADPSHLTQVLVESHAQWFASDAGRRNIDTGGENVEWQFSHRRYGHRNRDCAGKSRAHLRALLHDQGEGHRAGSGDLPQDYRSSRRNDYGFQRSGRWVPLRDFLAAQRCGGVNAQSFSYSGSRRRTGAARDDWRVSQETRL